MLVDNTRCLSKHCLTHSGVKCSLWEEAQETPWELFVDFTSSSGHKDIVLDDDSFCYKA